MPLAPGLTSPVLLQKYLPATHAHTVASGSTCVTPGSILFHVSYPPSQPICPLKTKSASPPPTDFKTASEAFPSSSSGQVRHGSCAKPSFYHLCQNSEHVWPSMSLLGRLRLAVAGAAVVACQTDITPPADSGASKQCRVPCTHFAVYCAQR